MKKMPEKQRKLRKASDVEKALHENPAADAVLRKLRSYLDTAEPDVVYFLVNTWNNQAKAITYKDLREAILAGELNSKWLEQWMQDYSRMVKNKLLPKWLEAMQAANTEREEKFPNWYFNPAADGVREWTESHAAEFVTQITNAQVEGLRAVIREATKYEIMAVDQLARAIRPLVGLTKPQATANFNYYTKLIESGLKKQKALDLSIRYAARQHRYRGYMIARTEIATAFSQGARQGVKQAQAKGYIGEVKRVWRTALDERTCSTCGRREGKEYDLDSPVQCPAHPCCRCTEEFIEISAL